MEQGRRRIQLQLRRWNRHFATTYVAKVTSSSPTGRTISAEVTPVPAFFQSCPYGYPLPRRDLVCKATQLIVIAETPSHPLFSSLHHPLKDYLASHALSLTPQEASEIMKSLNSPSMALHFFKLAPCLSPNFKHDAVTYTRLIHILSSSCLPDKISLIRAAVDEMDKSGVRGIISSVNILIGVLVEARDLEWCVRLVKKWNLRMTGYTFKCLIQAHLRTRDTNAAYRVYQEMKLKGQKLDLTAYNMLLDSLAKGGMDAETEIVFDDMRRLLCEPDVYTFTVLIRLKGKRGKTTEALAYFEKMLKKGILPNLYAYNTMIEALAKGSMTEKAIFLFAKMVERKCRPSEATYDFLLYGLAKEGKLHKLDEIVDISKEYLTRSFCGLLVRKLSQLGHSREAHRLFCKLWSFDGVGDRKALKAMVERFWKEGKIAEATDLLARIHEKGVPPDTVMYNGLISALGRTKQIPLLHEIFEKMKTNGPRPDLFTYNTVIASYGRTGHVHEAVRVFEELEKADTCKPDTVSYNSLINCLGKNGRLDEAHIRFKEMQEKGYSPDVFTYSTLIKCFGNSGMVEMAYTLFNDMVANGCSPSIVTYNTLLDCFERLGKTAEAVDLYAKLKEQGLTPDSCTYRVLTRLQIGSHGRLGVRRKHPITGWVVSPI